MNHVFRNTRLRSLAAELLALALFLPASAPSSFAADDTLVVARAMDLNSLDPARAYCDTCQIYLADLNVRSGDETFFAVSESTCMAMSAAPDDSI
jgi:hypothetical protein